MDQICLNDLQLDQISLNDDQFNEIQEAMSKGDLTYEQIEYLLLIAKRGDNARKLQQVIKGFQHGLTIDQVKIFTAREHCLQDMQWIRERIEYLLVEM